MGGSLEGGRQGGPSDPDSSVGVVKRKGELPFHERV